MSKLCYTTAFAATLAMTSFACAQAQDLETINQTVVAFPSSELATTGGATGVLHRIERAARRVCDSGVSRTTLQEHTVANRCRAEAMAQAIDALDAPLVTAAYAEGFQRPQARGLATAGKDGRPSVAGQ